LSHHHEDSAVPKFDKGEIQFREMTYVWVFSLIAGGAVMFSFLYFNSLEGFPAPPFMLAMLVGIGVLFALNALNLIVRSLFSLDD